jgi:hypothetical protein
VDPRGGLDELEKEKSFTLRRETKVKTAGLCTDAQFVNHLVCGGKGVMA